MDSQPTNPLTQKADIRFPNGNLAAFVKAPANAEAGDVIERLQIAKPRTLLVLIGGADELDQKLSAQLEQLLSRGLARAAADTEALIIDGGTAAGVMALMGKAVADRGNLISLLGVAPAGKVTYPGGPAEGSIPEGAPLDANHSHFVLVEGNEWSSGNEMMFKLAKELGAGSKVIGVLINGGPVAGDEVLLSVRQRWPIIVIEGSGRLADEIAMHWKQKTPATDSQMNEIISEGNIILFPSGGSPADLRQTLMCQIEDLLVEAWRRFAQYDSKAVSEKRWSTRSLFYTLLLGILGTFFALAEKQWASAGNIPSLLKTLVAYLVIASPIIVSVLLTVSNRLKKGQKWILLRGSAETVKKEIFRYRTRTGDYSSEKLIAAQPPVSREQVLAENILRISRSLMLTEVNTSSLPVYEGPVPPKDSVKESDDGFSFLTSERYIEVRLTHQLNYYNSGTRKRERQLVGLQWAILIAGGIGTLVATVGARLWIALTTAMVTALTAYVGQLQIERDLVKFNQAASDLSDMRAWWNALPPDARPRNKDTLVESSEKILESEQTGWVQQMQDAMADLRAASDEAKKK